MDSGWFCFSFASKDDFSAFLCYIYIRKYAHWAERYEDWIWIQGHAAAL